MYKNIKAELNKSWLISVAIHHDRDWGNYVGALKSIYFENEVEYVDGDYRETDRLEESVHYQMVSANSINEFDGFLAQLGKEWNQREPYEPYQEYRLGDLLIRHTYMRDGSISITNKIKIENIDPVFAADIQHAVLTHEGWVRNEVSPSEREATLPLTVANVTKRLEVKGQMAQFWHDHEVWELIRQIKDDGVRFHSEERGRYPVDLLGNLFTEFQRKCERDDVLPHTLLNKWMSEYIGVNQNDLALQANGK